MMTDNNQRPEDHRDEIDLVNLLSLLYARKLAIALVTFGAICLGVTIALLTAPTYQADA